MRLISRTCAGLLLAALLSLGVSGCLQTKGQRKAELGERAEELLPPGARIRDLGYGDCVELAASPSCAQVVFAMRESNSGRRAHLVRAAAIGHGWTIRNFDDAQGGWTIFLEREGFTAAVFLWRPQVYGTDCQGHPDPSSEQGRFCFNTLAVTRTGG
jgi:hypothetical protein